MAKYQGRKVKLQKRKKKKNELGSDPIKTRLSDREERKNLRVTGGRTKTVAVKARFANVSVRGKTQKVAIRSVGDNAADKDFKRESVLALGGEIETELGRARITSRPSQDGVVNAVLLE